MARKYQMRWNEGDRQKLQRVINNYNNKLYRVKKNNPDNAEYYPPRMTMKQAVEKIETRADYNRLINSLQRFSKRGAEEIVTSSRGAKATKWEVQEFQIAQRTVNAQRAKEREKIEAQNVKIGGKDTGQTRAAMGSIKENELKPNKTKFESKSQKEWDKARKAMDKALDAQAKLEKKERMRENYIKGLRDNNFLDASPELEKFIRGIDIDTFVETVELDETATFLFYKDPQAWETRREYIYNSWKTAYEGVKK